MWFYGKNRQGTVSRLRVGWFEHFQWVLGHGGSFVVFTCCRVIRASGERGLEGDRRLVGTLDQLVSYETCPQVVIYHLSELAGPGSSSLSRVRETPDIRASETQKIRRCDGHTSPWPLRRSGPSKLLYTTADNGKNTKLSF